MDTIDKTPQRRLIKKGAEASLFLTEWHGRKAIVKVRVPKNYRPKELDKQIRNYRTIHEPQLIHEAKVAAVPTPLIYMINMAESTIIMEFIDGSRVKELLNTLDKDNRHDICLEIGRCVARLHENGLIHGDLTTSNIIRNADGKIYFIDFGLGEKNIELEAQGVDLHLLKRALQSTHFGIWEDCFRSALCGYTSIRGSELAEKVFQKIREIERRGRYVEERKQQV